MKKKQDKKINTRYQQIRSGEAEPIGTEHGYLNLQPEKYSFANMPPDKLKEISKKGGEAVQKLHGERRTAKQALEKILTLKIDDDILQSAAIDEGLAKRLKRSNPQATLYDLIQIVAAGKAASGNIKAAEYIRDTYGDKPKEQIELNASITTDHDRELLQRINDRLDQAEHIAIIDEIKPPEVPPEDQ